MTTQQPRCGSSPRDHNAAGSWKHSDFPLPVGIMAKQSRPLSAEMFRLRDKAWSLWTPPGQAGVQLTALLREEKAVDYNDQQELTFYGHDDSLEESLFEKVCSMILLIVD